MYPFIFSTRRKDQSSSSSINIIDDCGRSSSELSRTDGSARRAGMIDDRCINHHHVANSDVAEKENAQDVGAHCLRSDSSDM